MLSLIHAVSGRPWAIRADIADHVRGLIAREGFAGLRHLAGLKAAIHAYDDDDGPDGRPQMARAARTQAGGGVIAVIPVVGTLTQRVEFIGSDATRSTADIMAEVQAAAADAQVSAIVLEIDSPGGEVFGVPEAWAAIRDAAAGKPVVAIANSMAASAALYLASAATELWVTPSGMVGSVGVYALHVDASKALEQAGESWTFVIAEESPFKVEGNPAGPLTQDARSELQKSVDRYMGMFVRDLARGRNVSREVVRKDFGKGRMLSPEEAVAAKMADRVGTLDQAIRRAAQLGRERAQGGPGPAAAHLSTVPEEQLSQMLIDNDYRPAVTSTAPESRGMEELQRQVAAAKRRLL